MAIILLKTIICRLGSEEMKHYRTLYKNQSLENITVQISTSIQIKDNLENFEFANYSLCKKRISLDTGKFQQKITITKLSSEEKNNT